MQNTFQVLIVDDSALYRQILKRLLNDIPGVEVVGTATNGKEALQKVATLRPHLLTLDMEMPEMDGLTTLQHLKEQYPEIKTLVLSHHTDKGAEITLKALRYGATDFITKPAYSGSFEDNYRKIQEELVPRIKAFLADRNGSVSGPAAARRDPAKPATPSFNYNHLLKKAPRDVIAIGSSTGGPQCLSQFFKQLPAGFQKPILIVQHMPPIFTQKLAQQLTQVGTVPVKEADEGDIVQHGQAYIAPGNYHMEVNRVGNEVRIHLHQGPKENFCRPAVDVLFRSVARVYGRRAIGVVLTGMGSDGLKGSKVMKEAGAPIIAQDKETSVVWGMPGFIVSENLADAVTPDHKIFETISEFMF